MEVGPSLTSLSLTAKEASLSLCNHKNSLYIPNIFCWENKTDITIEDLFDAQKVCLNPRTLVLEDLREAR